MSNIFEIIPGKKESDNSPETFSLGIKLKIGKLETICSITEYLAHDGLESKIDSLKIELDSILKKLETFSRGNVNQGAIDDDASPQEMWKVFSAFPDNSHLIEHFNSLSEFKRRELADYIFANCNIFTGKGAFFSAQYVQETALLVM